MNNAGKHLNYYIMNSRLFREKTKFSFLPLAFQVMYGRVQWEFSILGIIVRINFNFPRSTMRNDFLFLNLVLNMKGNFSRSRLEAWDLVPEILVSSRCGRLNRRKSHSRLGIEKMFLVELWCMGMSVLQWRPGCVTTKLLNLHFLKLEIANNSVADTFFVFQKRRSMQ